MAVQWSNAVRNAVLDAWETAMGTAVKLELRTGAQPANTAAAATGTILVTYTLASDWASNAAAASKALNNLPVAGTAVATGTFGHYRITDNAGTTCHEQGSVGTSGADLTVDAAAVSTIGQAVNITGYTKTAPHA